MHVVLYARVSTTRQADNDLSIPDQLRQLRNWCQQNGHLVVQEYVEPGATATDDKRPVFLKMMADALHKPPIFQAIIIHSFSRFYRDEYEFLGYERKLKRNSVKVISMTQLTSEDAGGELTRRLYMMFDEHQSTENSKHTSRAMKENARQGYFNGSRPPFGYMAVSTDVFGSRGRKKKKLAIDEAEADIVRRAYRFYLDGHEGKAMGCKEIAMHLNAKGWLNRGKPWTMQKMHTLLSDTLYMGDYYFNVIDSKTRTRRPPEEWVKTAIPPIIDAATFERVRIKRESRAPEKTPPRRTGSPTLLTGILKCGECGGHMTLATGKSGRYSYYKCTSRMGKGNRACASKNLPTKTMDTLILEQLADRVFTPERLQQMMAGLRARQRTGQDQHQETINEINRQIRNAEERYERLLDAIEKGTLELDEITQRRAQQLKAAREALIIELASVRQSPPMPLNQIRASDVEKFGQVLRKKLLSGDPALAKAYLNLLVEEIVVHEDQAVVSGSNRVLATTIASEKTKVGHLNQVPTFIDDWRARLDSNQ